MKKEHINEIVSQITEKTENCSSEEELINKVKEVIKLKPWFSLTK